MRRWCSYLCAMVTLLGCVNPFQEEEDALDAPILFGPAVQVETVAVKGPESGDTPSASSSFLFAGSQFGVFGSWSRDGVQTPELIFKQQPVECKEDGSTTNWAYTPLRYWRKSGIYKFCAVYPAEATCEYGSGPDRLVIKYSMHADHYDLMAAKATVNVADIDPLTHRVSLPFNHACAAIRFLFRNGVEDDNTTYHLNSFELQNLQTIGVFIYDSQNIVRDDWYPAATRAASVFEWEASASDPAFLIPDTYASYAQDHTKWLYVIPQTIPQKASNTETLGDYEPAVHFSVKVNLSDTNDPEPVHTTLSLAETTGDYNWEPGYLYTYYIRIQRSTVRITTVVEPWDSYKVAVGDVIFLED